MVELSGFDLPKDRSVMEVLDPDSGDPIVDETSKEALTITVLSSDSKEFKNREKRLSQRHVRRRRSPSVDELQTDRAVAATFEWNPPDAFMLDGKVLDCSNPEAIRKLYNRQTWLRDDVIAQSNDRSFYQGN